MTDDRVFTKCAWRLIPFMMLLYVINYLDRVNAGFAALTMNRDLGFSPSVFGFGAGLFFVGYLLFQVPSSVVLERAGTRRALFAILAVWGTISASTALVHSPRGFYLLRFVLGAAEAGFFPVMILYLTYWFPRSYRAQFTAVFMTAIPLASIVGAPVSGLLLQLHSIGGIKGWQWVFLIEGLPAVVAAFAVFRFLPASPAHAPWLSPAEKHCIVTRIAAEDVARHRAVWPALRDPRVIALGLVNFALLFAQNGAGLWLPQIIQAMGFSTGSTSLFAALPSLAGLPVMVMWARSSDRRDERIWHVALPALLAAAGFILTSMATGNALSLAAMTLAFIGILAMNPTVFGLLATYLSGPAVASGVALVLSISNIASFFGPMIVGVLKERTGGYSISMMLFALAMVTAALIVLAVGRTLVAHTAVEIVAAE